METGYTRCKQSGCAVFRVRKNPIRFPVTMAKGIHLFPYRTQKLSLSAPMVLGWRRPGRVGRCRIPQRKSLRRCLGLFLCASRQILLPDCFQANVQHCTWLGSPMCAASGGSSTWGNTWESRTLPDSTKKSLRRCLGLFSLLYRKLQKKSGCDKIGNET